MNKKLLVVALAVTASLLVATNAFANTSIYCTGGANLKFVGVGSSAQTNALAYAGVGVVKGNSHTANSYALISFGGSTITDKRATKTDTGITTWIAYDPSAVGPCDAYVYFQTDSGVGVKDFFAYEKFTSTSTVTGKQFFNSVAGAYPTLPALPISLGNKIPGLADGCFIGGVACPSGNDPNGVPQTISDALNLTPEAYVNQNGTGIPPAAPAYCGNVSTVGITGQFYCKFNAAGTDIRPEDALFATTRALTNYNGIVPPAFHGGTLTGLGYGATGGVASAGCTGGTANVGCGIQDSFNQNAIFNVINFKLTGSDPISLGVLPKYSTLSVGAAPMMVIAGNEDTSNLGSTFTDAVGNTNYTYNNINRETLSEVFSGYTGCVADLQSSSATNLGAGAAPLQVLNREPLSGTYNTFEFTATRIYYGGPTANATTPNANSDNGQEQFNDPNVFPSHTGATDCTFSSGAYPNANCFNPMYLSYDGSNIKVGSKCQGTAGGVAPGLPVRLRTIGSGMEVKGVIGGLNVAASANTKVFNPIGYAFWSYGNMDPLCSTISGDTCTGTWKGHYLDVDGIDPLFATPGGEFDLGYGNPGNPAPRNAPYNPSGVNNPPVCDLTVANPNCFSIPFTHIKDGSYPLWSLLRTVTFSPVAGKVNTPTGVLDMIANEEITSVTSGLSDFVPFLKNVSGSNGVYTGDLNLFVYRSHFKQAGGPVAAANGHKACAGSFTGVSLQGGTSTSSTCLVDFGSDEGGVVNTVQQDVDFFADFATEEYNLRQ
ncbi:MAG: hypothetical protein LAO24_03735 [Acidobacteriia bacterium]|nr:hypothetical protein [Terriglobia bacterium]